MRALPWLGLVLALGVARAALDADSGLQPWLHLRAELADARGRIEALRDETARLRDEAGRLQDDDFAVERAIREELELVRPGQTLVRLRRAGVPSARIP